MFIPAAICSPAIVPAICSPAVLATMPHKAVSVFNYASRRDGLLGSTWAQSMPGGCDYEQYWSGVLYGAYWQMPLNYHNKVETMSFPKIGLAKDRPVGDQMRPPYSPKLMSRKVFVLSKENTNCKKTTGNQTSHPFIYCSFKHIALCTFYLFRFVFNLSYSCFLNLPIVDSFVMIYFHSNM